MSGTSETFLHDARLESALAREVSNILLEVLDKIWPIVLDRSHPHKCLQATLDVALHQIELIEQKAKYTSLQRENDNLKKKIRASQAILDLNRHLSDSD
ncbi:hypothetical protein BGW36DRAFT_38537 [Talaromyces proteolyticus]|uniref:Uncharacterized protein n=1 Tax=Talaromyces proteolyticus TaxID=1131652 RepID=A0AAD4KID7_9EURO|nr:uncharacterized protein BGW36DRAFT_38537 [Talaromyces proteolyticus]KAH8691839.1 hypothetical protein BGW36DRAFT_38537 [Talaromyces proteolyticus]